MARLNLAASNRMKTYEGAPALPGLSPLKELRRAVLSCLLWEDMFYADGESIADRITTLAAKVSIEDLSALAIEARTDHNLRHAPLLLLDALTRRAAEINASPVTRRYTRLGSSLIADTIAATIQRPDELCELLAIYWRKGKHPISSQLRKGLAKALPKFSEYSLAKYDRDDKVKLRDVLRIARPTPKDEAQSQLWKRVVTRTLQTPDTWEVILSGAKAAGLSKKEAWEKCIDYWIEDDDAATME